MARKIETQHNHTPPTQLTLEPNTPALSQRNEVARQDDDRIAALERRFDQFFADFGPDAAAHNEQRFSMMAKQIAALRERVSEINDAPRLTADDVAQLSTALNAKVTRLVEDLISKEVTQIKIRMNSFERSEPSNMSEEIQQLSRVMSETGKLVVQIEQRGRDLESKFGELKKAFYTDLSNSMRLVVDSLQGASA